MSFDIIFMFSHQMIIRYGTSIHEGVSSERIFVQLSKLFYLYIIMLRKLKTPTQMKS